jgi:(2Fe-2S) ferredoxin
MEPSIVIEPGGTFYPRLDPQKMVRIIDALALGKTLPDLSIIRKRARRGRKRKTFPSSRNR